MPPPPDKKKKKKKAAPAPTENFQMPAPAGVPPVAGNNQLDAALQMPMPNIAELLKSQQGFEKDKAFSMLNSGALGPVKRDAYGDVRTGPANPWENGTFGTPEEVAQRAQTGRDQRKAEMARLPGQYNMPRPVSQPQAQQTQSAPVNVQQPQSRVDVFREAIEKNYPGLQNVQNMPGSTVPSATTPSPTALASANEAVNRPPTIDESRAFNARPDIMAIDQGIMDRQRDQVANNAEGAAWTGFQNQMNNSLRNLDEIIDLGQQPMGWQFGQFNDPNADRRQSLETDMNNSFPGASPMPPPPTNLFSQPGGNVLPFYIDTGIESLQKAMPGYDRFPWAPPPAGAPAPQNPAAVFPGATTPEKPLFDLSQMPGYMPPQPVGQSAQNWAQGAGQTLENIYAGLFGR